MANFQRIALDLNAPVARITLQHPPLNVIDIFMMEELAQALAMIADRSDVALLVMAGSDTAFSAGVDVAAHTPDKVSSMLEKFHNVIRALVASKRPTLAAVRGHCLGGGAELAMVCDFVITTKTATWGFPEIKLGCYPPVAATGLAALVGQKRAADLVLTGRTISGEEAAAAGLATRAVADSALDVELKTTLDALLKLSPVALSITRKAIYAWDAMHFDKGLARAEKIYLEELMKTADANEGVRAFIEKRKPEWQGK